MSQAKPKIRVVHWGTGAVGKAGLYYVLQHPELELVGLVVATDRNVGKDAGEIVGLPNTGVRAIPVTQAATMLDLKPDVLFYCGDAAQRDEMDAVREMAAFLECGVNVSTYVLISMHDPAFAPERTRSVIEQACAKGNSTFYVGGIDPGFSCITLARAALSLAGRIDKVMVTEYGNLVNYAVPAISRNNMGFGMPADYVPPRFQDGRVQNWWQRSVEMLARMLGVRLDGVRFTWDTALATRAMDTAFGRVDQGSVGGTFWRLIGHAGGRDVVEIRHLTQLSADFTKPGWPAAPRALSQGAIYEVAVEGDFSYKTMAFVDETVPRFGSDVAIVATATHALNAIPAVCAAPAGIIKPEDVPPFVRRMG